MYWLALALSIIVLLSGCFTFCFIVTRARVPWRGRKAIKHFVVILAGTVGTLTVLIGLQLTVATVIHYLHFGPNL